MTAFRKSVMLIIVVFSLHLQNRVAVANCQERYMILMKNYIESIRSFGEAIYLFPKVLSKIGELR